MHVFNQYWCGRIDGLQPTAGYYSDAQRWLQATSAEIDLRSFDRQMLIRER
jgi:hypothetical protein